MGMSKRKIQEYTNARNDGMEFALKIIEEKGIEGIAVSGAVLDSDDPADDMRMMIREIQNEDNI